MFGKAVSFALALAGMSILPATSFAQGAAGPPLAGSAGAGSAAISGVPIGPGGPGGFNNVLNDPSGIGNAAKVPPLPSPPSTPAVSLTPPAMPLTLTSPRLVVVPGLGRAAPRYVRGSHRRAAVSAQQRRTDRKFLGICRGC